MSFSKRATLLATILAVLGVVSISALAVVASWTADSRWAGTGWAIGAGLIALAFGCFAVAVMTAEEPADQ